MNGQSTEDWQYVRQTANYKPSDNAGLLDVTSLALRCYELPDKAETQTATVAAGSTVGFTVMAEGSETLGIFHQGPLLFYMAKVPTGETAATWDGSGDVWFKIYDEGPIFGETVEWPSFVKTQVTVQIPPSLPSGEYLLRVEHIALHVAHRPSGAQFFLACAQLNVIDGGNGTPGPLVAFPGAYSGTDPGILIEIYLPPITSYTMPGPPIWDG
ncbi:hypothetical protein AJ80_02977 [Polytolypa hystricis UAMH7299]|uniref:lytic cellulose monooxygenase (C4-dehydrogenating) n=1 Tax=Polytolypa hystricis (strain UAMH7299) TaxID=1447883 RepID=A0A2B7YPY8_POLH7|nr:hypothetical protein AJ80_02977 [Polytolypa hystricis UAMH7299]